MNAGRLRHRLTYQERPDGFTAARNAANELTAPFADVATVWGAVEPLSGRELFNAAQVQADVSCKVRVRYPRSFSASAKGRWKYSDPGTGQDRYFNVVAVTVPDERRVELVCYCQEYDAERAATPAALIASPLALPGLALWAAADGTLLDSSGEPAPDFGLIATARDGSGNARDLAQALLASEPTLIPAARNGRPVIRFDGVNDFLAAAFPLAQPYTVYLAGALRSLHNGDGLFDGMANVTGLLYQADGAGGLSLFAGGGPGALAAVNAGDWHVLTAFFSGGSSSLRLDASPPHAAAGVGTPAPNGLTLGARFAGSQPAAVDVGEIFIVAGSLSAANDAAALAYLKSRWGTP